MPETGDTGYKAPEEQQPQEEEEGISVIALMLAAHNAAGNTFDLKERDNDGPLDTMREHKNTSQMDQLRIIRTFSEKVRPSLDEERQAVVDSTIAIIDATLTGAAYRQEHHLPGVGRQMREVRQQLYQGDISQAAELLQALAAQPDAASEVVQLREEYTQISDLRESGQIPDVQVLSSRVYRLGQGLRLLPISHATDVLRSLEMYRGNVEAIGTLAQMQGDERLLDDITEELHRLEDATLARVEEDLSFRINHVTSSREWSWQRPGEAEIKQLPMREQVARRRQQLLEEMGITEDELREMTEDPEGWVTQLQGENDVWSKRFSALHEQRWSAAQSPRNRLSRMIQGKPSLPVREADSEIAAVGETLDTVKQKIKATDSLSTILEADEFLAEWDSRQKPNS